MLRLGANGLFRLGLLVLWKRAGPMDSLPQFISSAWLVWLCAFEPTQVDSLWQLIVWSVVCLVSRCLLAELLGAQARLLHCHGQLLHSGAFYAI